MGDGLMQPLHGFVHVGHEERVVQVLQAGAEKTAGLIEGLHAALHQQIGQNPVDTEFRRQLRRFLRVGRRLEDPLSFRNAHSPTKLINFARNCNPLPHPVALRLPLNSGKCTFWGQNVNLAERRGREKRKNGK